jgi:fructose-1,6-bisphosphatase/sedoheptulose 1,7-bisphosphatase-like protein
MDKIAVGPKVAGCIDIRLSPRRNVHAIAKALSRARHHSHSARTAA